MNQRPESVKTRISVSQGKAKLISAASSDEGEEGGGREAGDSREEGHNAFRTRVYSTRTRRSDKEANRRTSACNKA